MDIKKALLISLVAVAILASVSVVSAGLFDGLFGEEQKDQVIEIDHIAFNTTNVTKFKLYNKTKGDGGYYKWYMDENHTGYNVHIYNWSKSENLDWAEALKWYKGDSYDNIPSETIDGVVVYTTTANVGDLVGEPRYKTYIENRDAKCIIELCTPYPNETAKMASTLKFK